MAENTDRIRLLVIDDQPLFRAGMMLCLKARSGFEFVGEETSLASALPVLRLTCPDLVILSVGHKTGGLQIADVILREFPAMKIIILTDCELKESALEAIEAGAHGYLPKKILPAELVQAVRTVTAGRPYLSPGLAARLLGPTPKKWGRAGASNRNRLSTLTAREIQMMEQLAKGLTNKEIARKLALSEKTIKRYMANIKDKLQVRNRVEAVIQFRNKIC